MGEQGGAQGCKAGKNEYGFPETEPFQLCSQWLQLHGKPSQKITEKNHAASSSHPKVVKSKELLQGSMLQSWLHLQKQLIGRTEETQI